MRLTVDNPNVALSTDTVSLVNGLGSVLVDIAGSGDFTLTAWHHGIAANRQLTSLAAAPVTEVSGTLSGSMTNWSGVVHVSGDVTVPAGHVLNILPDTLVLAPRWSMTND